MTAEPIAYTALPTGIPVRTSNGTEIGTVEHVLAVPSEDLFDGLVVKTRHGLRFVDRDQTDQLTTEYVTTSITDAQADSLPRPSGTPTLDVEADDERSVREEFGRLFNRPHWHQAD